MRPVLSWERRHASPSSLAHLLFHIPWCWKIKQWKFLGHFIFGGEPALPSCLCLALLFLPSLFLPHPGAPAGAETNMKNLFCKEKPPGATPLVLGEEKYCHPLRFKKLQPTLGTLCSCWACSCVCVCPVSKSGSLRWVWGH